VAAPPVGIFPGCMIQSQCLITDAVQVQHPRQGALTLVALVRRNDDYGGAVYAVDADGTVTDTAGTLAGSSMDEGGGYATHYRSDSELQSAFRFSDPTTDRSGMVFYEAPGEDGNLSEALAVDPDGYFERFDAYSALESADWDEIQRVGGGYEDSYYTSSWGDIDARGYRTLIVGEGDVAVTLHREGDSYVVG
jgi:hypothetical protein